MLAYLILPILALLFSTTPAELLNNLTRPIVYQAILISLWTSAIAVLVTVIFGIPVAYLMARRQFRFKRVVDSVLDLPTVLPPAVAGVALLMIYGRRGILGGWLEHFDIHIAFTPIAVIIAQIFIASPFFIKSAAIGFGNVEPELEQAAALDGASSWYIFRMITLPLSRIALLSGLVLMWARALGEFGATIIFAGNFPGLTQTMPLAIYLGFEMNTSYALTLSVILIGISFMTLIAVKSLFIQDR
jgi:molybdate transport system permease protein